MLTSSYATVRLRVLLAHGLVPDWSWRRHPDEEASCRLLVSDQLLLSPANEELYIWTISLLYRIVTVAEEFRCTEINLREPNTSSVSGYENFRPISKSVVVGFFKKSYLVSKGDAIGSSKLHRWWGWQTNDERFAGHESCYRVFSENVLNDCIFLPSCRWNATPEVFTDHYRNLIGPHRLNQRVAGHISANNG